MDDTAFEHFWSLYPRRVGKGDARKVWAKLKPSKELVDVMVEAIAWQRNTTQWQKEHGQFIPHPATWLRQERWSDEPFVLIGRSEWVCPHEPHCGGRWACEKLTILEKARQR